KFPAHDTHWKGLGDCSSLADHAGLTLIIHQRSSLADLLAILEKARHSASGVLDARARDGRALAGARAAVAAPQRALAPPAGRPPPLRAARLGARAGDRDHLQERARAVSAANRAMDSTKPPTTLRFGKVPPSFVNALIHSSESL